MKFESLKEKYNYYRNLTDYRLMPNGYVMIMLDGRSFSKKINKKFKRPFDAYFIYVMNETAKYVCENVSGCKLAYVQSDEINLILHDNSEQDPFFGNRLCKLQSVIASMATAKFNQLMVLYNIDGVPASSEDIVDMVKKTTLYEFDCKAWTVPNVNDAFASILYRQNDCVRNSKEAVAQTYLSHKELHGKQTSEQIEMVKERFDIDWNTDYDRGAQYGRFILKDSFEIMESDGYGRYTGKIYNRTKWFTCKAYSLNDDIFSDEVIKYIVNKDNHLIEKYFKDDKSKVQFNSHSVWAK